MIWLEGWQGAIGRKNGLRVEGDVIETESISEYCMCHSYDLLRGEINQHNIRVHYKRSFRLMDFSYS